MMGAWAAGLLLAAAFSGSAAEEPGLYFGAPGGVVTLPDPAIADGATPLTVEFRFKTLEKLKNAYKTVSRWDAQSKDADRGTFFVEVGSSGRINFGLLNAQGTPKTISARAAWKDGVWHHVAAVWDGTEASITVDGKRVATEKLEGFGKLASSRLPIVIGHATDPKIRAKDFFEGFISDVGIWNSARDAETITAGLKAPLAGSEAGLAAFVALRGKSGASALSPGLERAGWCRTPWWFEEKPDRPYVHLFSVEAGLAEAGRSVLVDNESKAEIGVVWQDKAGKVQVTWVDAGLGEPRTVPLKGLAGATLAAAAADSKGNLYYLMIEPAPAGRSETTVLKAAMVLAAPDGKPIKEVPFDTSKEQFNVYEYGGRWVASMAIGKDSGCLILPRTMFQSPDGLHHQGAIAVTFAPDLSKFQNHGQTSGHSFGNLLTENAQGQFLGLDLGDNYPRGVHLHRIDRGGRASRVLFTYKTAHGTSARNGSAVYPEISGNGKTFYKWSNDNGTYTELGGVVEGRATYSVFFSTDRSPEGKVLDNSRIGVANEPRDLAMLRVIKNFEKAPEGTQVSDALMAGLPPGSKPETGGFFDFGGRWVDQRVTGVLWLTKYASGEAAHAPQVFRRKDGTMTVVWEKTGGDGGNSLWAMTVDESGRKLTEALRLGVDVHLGHEMLPLRVGDRLFTLSQEGARSRLSFLRDD